MCSPKEIVELEKYLIQALPKSDPAYVQGIKDKVAWIKQLRNGSTSDDPEDWGDYYPALPYEVWTATMKYGATGEGETLSFYATKAYDQADMLRKGVGKMGWWHSLGADIYHGLPPCSNSIVKHLVSNKIWKEIELHIEQQNKPGVIDVANLDIFLNYHANYS